LADLLPEIRSGWLAGEIKTAQIIAYAWKARHSYFRKGAAIPEIPREHKLGS